MELHSQSRNGAILAVAAGEAQETPKLRIGLIGYFGAGNLGNDGSLEAGLRMLQRIAPRAEVTCICTSPDLIRAAFGMPTLPYAAHAPAGRLQVLANRALGGLPIKVANWVSAFRECRRLDALIVPGTGILDDYGTGPGGMPFALFRWCLMARLVGTPVAFLSVGAGPIHHPVCRWLMRAAARLATYRTYRDTLSRDFMASIGLDSRRDGVFPDIAFSLPAPPPSPRPKASRGLCIGIGIMKYNGWSCDDAIDPTIGAKYLDDMTHVVRHVLSQGHDVRLLIGEASDDVNVHVVIGRLTPDERARVTYAPVSSLNELLAQIDTTDMVIASRYHNLVCALRLAKPVISLGYAAKNDALLAGFGLQDYCQHVERIDHQRLEAQLARLIAVRGALIPRLEQAVREVEVRLSEQEQLVRATLVH